MLAALASLGIFVSCAIVGLGLVSLLSREDRPYLPLLAPTMGFAALGIPTVWLSIAGIPIGRFGPWLMLLELGVAAAVLAFRRRKLRLPRYWPFALIVLAGFFLSGRPLFEFGFNWLSYSNDDMTNYALTAERILAYGFYTVPAPTYYSFNRDPALVYFLWAVVNERFGGEAFVSLWLSVFRGLNSFQLFMPVMIALGMMQITTGAALLYRNERYRTASIVTAALLAVCALATFGVEYQLLGQISGLPLIAASALLILDVPQPPDFRSILLAAIATTSLSMVYPEITPFLVLSIVPYILARLVKRTLSWPVALVWLGSISALTLVFLNAYLRNFAFVLLARIAETAAPLNPKFYIELFPFYLIPSGVANLFGIYSSVRVIPEPWLSLGILVGFCLLVVTAFSSLEGTLSAEPAGAPALIMFLLALVLFYKHAGYGLFKIAMYLQPFIIPCMVLWWLRLSKLMPRRAEGEVRASRWRVILFSIPVVIFGLLNLGTQQYYVERSRAYPTRAGATFVEIFNASPSHLLDEFATLQPLAHEPRTTFISDTFNIVYAKIENFYTKPAGLIFPSDDFLRGNFTLPTNLTLRKLMIPSLLGAALDLSARRQRHFREPFFAFTQPHGPTRWDGFFADDQVPGLERHPQSTYVIADTAQQTIFNRRYSSDIGGNFQVLPLAKVRNHLIFIASQYGLAYYSGRSNTALFQLEPDLFYDGKTMAGIGRRFLLNVLNPSKKLRLEVTFTETLKDDGECILHTPSLLGISGRKVFAKVVGRGSARVFFPAVAPRILVGQPYVFLDMEVDGTLFPMKRTGLMRLYGLQYPLDSRHLVGFARDVSAVSEDDYNRMRRPTFLAHPSADLLNPNLEYSGAYEDGWISEASQYVLSQPARGTTLAVRGLVPLIGDPNYRSIMRLLVNDREVGRLQVGVGTFDARFAVPHTFGPARVKVAFDRYQRLPNGDGRPVAMKLLSIGFQTPEQSSASLRSVSARVRQQTDWRAKMAKAQVEFGGGWYPIETYAGQTFRWANNDAYITIGSMPNQKEAAIDVEPGPGEGNRMPVLHVFDGSGHDLRSAVLQQGRQTVTFPLTQPGETSTYVLHIEGGGSATTGDPRILDFRLFSVSVR